MAVKYLDAKRLQGTNAERIGMTSGNTTPHLVMPETDQYVDIPTTSLTTLATGSVSFWVFPETGNGGDNIVISSSDISAGSAEWTLGYSGSGGSSGVRVFGRTGTNVTLTTSALTTDAWNHVVYTNDSSSGNKVYINGSQVTPSYSAGSASSNSFFATPTGVDTITMFANRDSGAAPQWGVIGNVQQVLIYSAVLSGAEVTTLYNSGSLNTSPSTTNLLRKYDLQGDFNDTSGNGHNGSDDGSTAIPFTAEVVTGSTVVNPNLPAGTIFSTTDTYKYYWWNGTDTWSESG